MRRWVNTFQDDARGWQMVKWWASRERRKCLVWPLSIINLNARTLSDVQARKVTTQWKYLLLSVILISHSLACPDVRGHLCLTFPGAGAGSRVLSESESLVPPCHYLESYHYQQPGSARTKLLTQTFAHSASSLDSDLIHCIQLHTLAKY